MFALLKPTFSLLDSPHLLAASASPHLERSPTNYDSNSTASVGHLAPFIFGAGALDQ